MILDLSISGYPPLVARHYAVVSESSFKSVDSAIASSFEHFIDLPAFPYAPITVFIIEQRLGINADQMVTEEVVGLISPRPVFIIHGQDDETIVTGDAKALYDAAKEPKEDLWLIPGAGHDEGVEIALEEYGKRVVDFFNRHLMATGALNRRAVGLMHVDLRN